MNKCVLSLQKVVIGAIVLFLSQNLCAQFTGMGYREKDFQLSFFPGISTNGLSSGLYYNRFSINITSGFSAGNKYFELGAISNSHTRSSTGILIAGLANITGANSYIHMTYGDIKDFIEEGDQSNVTGIQLSGLLNFVRDDIKGFQLTGGFNVNGGEASAIQLAGIGNGVGLGAKGVQIAGVYNTVGQAANGIQLSLVYNRARWEISGFQIGMINKTRRLGGRNSTMRTSARGKQFGLFNLAKQNDGLQVGLINFGGQFRGTQIGLINFFQSSPYSGGSSGKYGVPIGLLNLGFMSHVRVFTDELFLTNVELATGNCYNCTWTESSMPLDGRFMVRHENAFIFGLNYWDILNEYRWTAGYGFERLNYNKSSMSKFDPNNKKFFYSYGLRVQHLNKGREFNKQLSLLSRGNAKLGYKLLGVYLFTGFTFNYYLHRDTPFNGGLEIIRSSDRKTDYQMWLGYMVGVQL